ncbi:MAG: DUF3488 domain-containing transglutaminase family protein [Gammaproteobacteria bacterium]|nr:DUF3488 domain-containing transglutaminase family protein [Gammaproteobacteria bacterium]
MTFIPLLITSLVLTTISHYQSLPIIFILVNFSVLAWFFFTRVNLNHIQLKPEFGHPALKHLFTVSFLVILISYYGFHFTQDIATTLLTSMLCLKLLEINNKNAHRHITMIIYLQFFSLIVSFLNSQEFLLVIYNFIVLLFLLFLLLHYQIEFRGNCHDSNNQTLSYGSTKRHTWFTEAHYLKKIIVITIPITIFLFLFFPRIPGPLWTLPSLSQQSVTGLSDSMYPGSVNELSQSEELVFTVKFEDKIPSSDQLYWRGPVLTKTDGFLWEQIKKRTHSRPLNKASKVDYFSEPISYEINLQPQQQKWLFTLDMPYSLSSPMIKNPFLSDNMQFLVRYNIRQLVQYSALSYRDYYLKSIKQDIQEALIYPHPSNPETYALGQELAKNNSPKQIIQLGLDYYLEKEFFYTLKPNIMTENPSDQFLFQYRRGFCEHFASSFVLLMRAANIPARVVTGYQGMSYNKVGDYYRVTQSNAHAWAEVWLEESGWTRIDPTAVIPQQRIENDIFERQQDNLAFYNLNYSDVSQLQKKFKVSEFRRAYLNMQQSLHYLNYRWNQWVISYDTKKQNSLLNWLNLKNLTQILWIAISVFSLFIVFFMWSVNRKQKKTNDPLLKLYQQLITKLKKHGFDYPGNQPPQLTKQQSLLFFPENSKELEDIFNLFIKLRYTNSNTEAEKKSFKKLVNRLKILNN